MGRKCRRELGYGDKRMMDIFLTIFLMPFIVFKYAFSIAFWYYGIAYLLNSKKWHDMSRTLKDLWR